MVRYCFLKFVFFLLQLMFSNSFSNVCFSLCFLQVGLYVKRGCPKGSIEIEL